MKKFLVVVFVLLAISALAAGIFLMTLDVDRFRPQIVSQIENAIHKPVRLEKIKLGWQSGIALELRGFAILKSKQGPEELVKVDSAKAVLKLAPLLSRRIQIATIYLRHPSVNLIKKPDGTFEGLEPEEQAPGTAAGVKGETAVPEQAAVLSFLISEIEIDNGEVFFRDMSGKEPVEVTLRKVDVVLEDVALDQPVDCKIKAAVFSDRQNLDITGKLTVSSQGRENTVSGIHAALQFAPMDFREIVKVSPDLKTSGIVPPLEGTLTVDVDSVKIDDQGIKNDPAKVRFEGGRVRLQSLKSPVKNISMDALATTALVTVRKFEADVADGKVEGQGTVNLINPSAPVTAFYIKANNLKVENLVAAPPQAGPQVKGALSVAVKGNLIGQMPDEIQRTLTADGTVNLEQGVITNMNVLREVFQKISVIPGLVERLLARLPQDYKGKLNEKDTKLKTIQIPFSVRDGMVDLPRLSAATDSFRLEGSGRYGLAQGDVAGAALLSIDKDLSAAMIRSVAELQYLTNEKAELQIPLSFQGRVPNIMVMPDLQSVAAKVVTQKAQDVIGGYLEKALGKKETPQPQQAGTPSAPSEPAKQTSPFKKGAWGDLLRQVVTQAGTE